LTPIGVAQPAAKHKNATAVRNTIPWGKDLRILDNFMA